MPAVKLYSTMPADNANVLAGIDGKIPAEVVFADTAPDETYTVMSDEEYRGYLNSISTELEEWKAIQATLPVETPQE